MTSAEFWDCDYGKEQVISKGYGIRLPSGFVARFADKESRDKVLEELHKALKTHATD